MENINNFISRFGDLYANRIEALCNPLADIKIQFVSFQQYQSELNSYPVFDHNENDLLSYYIDDTGCKRYDEYKAFVVYNFDIYEELQITELELYAGIAHEMGHMADYILRKNCIPDEYYADAFCGEIGLSTHLISLLNKLISSSKYNDCQCKVMKLRIKEMEDL